MITNRIHSAGILNAAPIQPRLNSFYSKNLFSSSRLSQTRPSSRLRSTVNPEVGHLRYLHPSSCSSHPFSTSTSTQMSSSIFSAHRLQDKVVLITGASAGIGRSTAILFAKAGSNVVLTARRQERLNQTLEDCSKAAQQGASGKGGKFKAISLDVQDRKAIEDLPNQLPDWAKGKIDIVVNNAGLVLGVDKVGDISLDEIDTMINTNIKGLIQLSQMFIKDFKQRKHPGHLIQLGSIAGREPYPAGSIYCMTKHAIRAFNAAMLREVVDTKIRVTEIQPGMVETDFSVVRFRGDKQAADNVYKGIQPLTPEDIAEEIVWAASRPPHVNVAETLVFPVNQASPFHNYKGE